MRSFIYSLIFSSASLLLFTEVQAQKKQTIYYPNGKIAFEGQFQLAWNQSEKFEATDATESERNLEEEMDLEDRGRMLSFYKDIIPSRIYEGTCRYYYRDGQLFAEGNYTSGFKNGTFKFYHPNGKLGARQSYEWGMASGHWESWDEQGRLTKSFHYQAIPENTLQSVNEKSITSDRDDVAMGIKLFFGREYENFFEDNQSEFGDHWHNLAIFKRYVVKKLYHKAIKEGVFKVWEGGKPYLDMNFSNNIPVGTWRIYKDDKPGFEIVFEGGKIIKATDLLNPANNFGSPEYLARQKEVTHLMGVAEPNAVDLGIPQKEEIFRTVQQMPEPGYDLNKYFIDNLKMPKSKDATGGRVTVQFVVRKDGRIDKLNAVRSEHLDPVLVKEVIRVAQQMPKWKPGRHNGQAVDVYYTYPINVRLQ